MNARSKGTLTFKRGQSPLKVTVPFVSFLKVSVPFVVLLAAPAAFACDPTLEATVSARPDDTDSRDALARSCARAGDPEAALRHYDVLLERDASNADWLLGKSQALVALQRPREALPLLEKGRALAPAYEDIWRVNASALESAGEFTRADILLAEAAIAFPQSTWPDRAAQRTRRAATARARHAAFDRRQLRGPLRRPASPGAARPSASTGGSTRTSGCSRACTSRSDSTRATNRSPSATRAASMKTGRTPSSATWRPMPKCCRSGASPSRPAARSRARGASGCALRHASYLVDRRRHARRNARAVLRYVPRELHAQHREDERHQRPELRPPPARDARLRPRQPRRHSPSDSARKPRPSRPGWCWSPTPRSFP